MKLIQELDIQKFLVSVNKCEGDVIIIFSEGNELNMKSMLSKVVFATLYEKKDLLKNAEVLCEIKADEEILEKFTSGIG